MTRELKASGPDRPPRLMVVRVVAKPDGRVLRFYDWPPSDAGAPPNPRDGEARAATGPRRS